MNIDYDEIQCPQCGRIGVEPDGGFDWYCPVCSYQDSLIDEE